MRGFLSVVLMFWCAVAFSQTLCAGSTITLTATNPQGLNSATFSINPGGVQNNTGTFAVSPSVTTSFTIYTSGKNSSLQQTTTISVSEVTVFPKPAVDPVILQPNCTNSLGGFDLQLTFAPNQATPSYTIYWQPIPNNVLTYTQTSSNGVFAGTYQATVSTVSGCTAHTQFKINTAPSPANFTYYPSGDTLNLTCFQPSLTFSGSDPTYSYTWTSLITGPVSGSSISVHPNHAGNWTVTGTTSEGICSATHTFYVRLFQQLPTSTITPSLQSINCIQTGIQTITLQAFPPTNVSQVVYDPKGGVFSSLSDFVIYNAGSVGVFTHCAINTESGCKSCKQFTITSTDGFPTFELESPDNYTLGCSTKSIATLMVKNASATYTNQIPNGGSVSYTLMPPGSIGAPGGTLSGVSVFTVNQPGTYTVVVQDLSNGCRTKLPVTILLNTKVPDLSVVVPHEVLDCTYSTTVLKALSSTPDVSYQWSFQGTPGNTSSSTIQVMVDLNARSKTVINDYTLSITNRSSFCKSYSVVTIFQNVFLPNTNFSLSEPELTCKTPTVLLTNMSSTGIPPGMYPSQQPVIAWVWSGPTPQKPLQVATTYVGGISGTYTLVGKDLNNGCVSVSTRTVGDYRKYPLLNNPVAPPPSMLECGAEFTTLSPIITTNTSALVYEWFAPPTATIGNQHTKTLMTNEVGIYTVNVTDAENSCASSVTMSVISGSITAEFDIDKPRGVVPHTVRFYNNSSYSATKGNANKDITSVWSFGNGTTSGKKAEVPPGGSTLVNGIPNTDQPFTTYLAAGIYTVTLFVSKGLCEHKTQRLVVVETPSGIEVPNVFTPNGDGVNDEFFLKADRIQNISIVVCDRWGKLVFQSTSDTGNISWNGKNLRGEEVADGVFYYTLSALGKDGEVIDKKGTITLFR